MDFTTLMRQYHIARQQVLTGIVFGNDTGQQVALGRNDFTVFVCVFVQQCGVGLFHQPANFLVQAAPFFTRDITIVAIFNIGTRELLVGTGHELVFDSGLDFVDVDL